MSQNKKGQEGVKFDENIVADSFGKVNDTRGDLHNIEDIDDDTVGQLARDMERNLKKEVISSLSNDSDDGIDKKYLDDDIDIDIDIDIDKDKDDDLEIEYVNDEMNDNKPDGGAAPTDLDKTEDSCGYLDEDDDMDFNIIDLDNDTHLNSINSNKKYKKPLFIALGGILGVLLLSYIIGVVYFSSHFQFNTKINGTDFSLKTAAAVEGYMKDHVKGYELTLKESTGSTETIVGSDISLNYKVNGEVKKVMKKQNAFLWPQALFKKTSLKSSVKVDYDEQALTDLINQLNVMKPESQTPPANAQPVFNETSGAFDIVAEVPGTQINQEVFTKAVTTHITGFKKELDMISSHSYMEPKFTDKSPEVAAARDTMNTYLNGTVTYNVGEKSEAVTKAMIAGWLGAGENMEVVLNTDAINAYVAELNSKYSTVGATRSITSPNGKVSQVSGGTFGWAIDQQGEATALVANIQAGQPVTREPVYSQTGRSHGANDWGNTYVEVDLTSQYMWYVVNGSVVLETAVVTGLPTPEKETPQGVYDILEIAPDQILKGSRMPNGELEYETPVAYWMRVTWSGIGFHDAGWQPTFGGDWYLEHGSHGCINMPPSVAGSFFSMLQMRDPVIMHY